MTQDSTQATEKTTTLSYPLRRILSPVMEFKGITAFQFFFRIAFFTTGLIGANTLAEITNLAVKGSDIDTMIRASIPLIIGLIINVIILIPYVRTSTWGLLRTNYILTMEKWTLETLLHADDAVKIQSGIGKRVSVIQNGHSSWNNYIQSFLLDFMISAIYLAGGIGYLVTKNVMVIPFVLVYMGIVFLFIRSSQIKLTPFRQNRRKLAEEYNRRYVRSVMEKLSIMLHNAIGKEEANRAKMGEEFLTNVRNIEVRGATAWWIPRFILEAIRLSVIIAIGWGIVHGKAQMGDIIAFGIVFSMIEGNFQRLLESYQSMQDSSIQMNRLFEYLDSLAPLERLTKGNLLIPKTGHIELKKVGFSYPEGKKDVIKNLSLTFEGGKKTALVGRSGAGKSTIVKLILGLMLADKGKIEIDGQDIADIRLDSYFPHVGYLSQEPSVFDGTIRENMAYGMDTAPTDEELFTALKHARAEFVELYDQGLDTEIGERGVRLSGGERQRLAIARIFLRNPTILVLDEPTSALDSFSEKAVTDALHELFKNKTVIVVAHRLQTVKEADMIYVLNSEGVVEFGNHETLLTSGGEYSKMVDLQSGTVKEDIDE